MIDPIVESPHKCSRNSRRWALLRNESEQIEKGITERVVQSLVLARRHDSHHSSRHTADGSANYSGNERYSTGRGTWTRINKRIAVLVGLHYRN
jgi:hypothetical protein